MELASLSGCSANIVLRPSPLPQLLLQPSALTAIVHCRNDFRHEPTVRKGPLSGHSGALRTAQETPYPNVSG